MGALGTLRRHLTKERVTLPDGQVVFADLPQRPRRIKPGQRNRKIKVIREPSEAYPYWILFHATKGWRRRTIWR